jgi:hypothetical protein
MARGEQTNIIANAGSDFGLRSAWVCAVLSVVQRRRPGLTGGVLPAERRAMKKFLAVVLEMTMNALAKITFSCQRMARHGIAFPFRAVIGLAALSLLNGVGFGQLFSGPGVFSGNTQFGAPGGSGAPLTYSARTDGCVNPTVTPSSCVGGTTTGQVGATLLFQEASLRPPSPPVRVLPV